MIWGYQVTIWGCARTRRATFEAVVGPDLVRAATVRDLVRAAAAAGDRLRRLGAFDTISITLDAAPFAIPGSAVVVLVDIAEAASSPIPRCTSSKKVSPFFSSASSSLLCFAYLH